MGALSLSATPYASEGPFFFFSSMEEYEKKYKGNVDKYTGLPYEEYMIDFQDGDASEATLFKAMEVSQANVDEFFDLVDTIDEDQLPAIQWLTDRGYDFKEALEKAEEVMLREGDLEDAAYDYVEDVGIEGADPNGYHFNYDGFGRDIRIEGGFDPSNDEDQHPVQEKPTPADFPDEDDLEEAEEQYEEYQEAQREYDRMSDQDLGYYVVDDVYGGLSEVGEQTLANYFDYADFGSTADINGDWDEFDYEGTTYVVVNASDL